MILYVDETENNDYFIVAGLLVESKEQTDFVFKQFKRKVKNFRLTPREKEKVFIEFKATILDREYQRIKVCMLEHINRMNYSVFYSVYPKNGQKFYQEYKEQEYIRMLEKIVSNINKNIDIIFDAFKKKDFEEKIIKIISSKENVLSIQKRDSRLEDGLKFVDNICSIIRLYKTSQNTVFYHLLSEINEI